MPHTKLGKLLAPLALLIIAASLVGYAVSHKPFEALELLSLLTALYRIGIAAVIILLAGGLGRKFRRGDNEMNPALAARDAAIGLGVIGLGIFFLGVTVGFNLCIFLALVVIGLTLLMGFAGQVSLGQGGFFLIGAYTSGLLTMGLDADTRLVDPEAGIDPLLAVAIAPFVSAAGRTITQSTLLSAMTRSWRALSQK